MDSINDTTVRTQRNPFHACRACVFAIVAVSGALGCASANGGMRPREPGVASVELCGDSPARAAAPPLAEKREGAFQIAYLAPAERVLDARRHGQPHGIARTEDARLARERELANASSFEAIGLLESLADGEAPGPRGSWGTPLDGTDDVREARRLFVGTIDDALGFGGLRVSGHDQAGRGRSTR